MSFQFPEFKPILPGFGGQSSPLKVTPHILFKHISSKELKAPGRHELFCAVKENTDITKWGTTKIRVPWSIQFNNIDFIFTLHCFLYTLSRWYITLASRLIYRIRRQLYFLEIFFYKGLQSFLGVTTKALCMRLCSANICSHHPPQFYFHWSRTILITSNCQLRRKRPEEHGE